MRRSARSFGSSPLSQVSAARRVAFFMKGARRKVSSQSASRSSKRSSSASTASSMASSRASSSRLASSSRTRCG
ncbi:MAG: hypothetical protein CMN29_04060 [Sandaracinus sp.]|nr:hypothetical protein [Myxococcales bacterium]MAT24134.1 hypothetical protein [Sandaracinus sp.]